MPYCNHLKRWLVVRLRPNLQRIVVVRFWFESDADGYLKVLQQLIPNGNF